MAYLPNIPQGTDNLSTSQGQILANFQSLETGFAVDHNTWDAANAGTHKQVTAAAQASVSPPSGWGTYYTSLTGSVGGAIAEGMYKSGDNADVSLTSAVKAWVSCNSSGTILDGFNVASVTHPGTGQYVVNFSNALSNSNYGVIGMCQMDNTFGSGAIMGYNSVSTTSFQVNTRALSGGAVGANVPFSVVVIKS